MASFGDDSADFVSGYSQVFAPALQGALASGLTGSAALGAAFTAAGPIGIGLGILSAISGRRKRRRRRRQARRKLKAARVTARGQARHIGVQGQQAVGQITASGTQFGGTIAAGLSQAVMGNVFLEQQRIMQGVGLTAKKMAKAQNTALRRAALKAKAAERHKRRNRSSSSFAQGVGDSNRSGNV